LGQCCLQCSYAQRQAPPVTELVNSKLVLEVCLSQREQHQPIDIMLQKNMLKEVKTEAC